MAPHMYTRAMEAPVMMAVASGPAGCGPQDLSPLGRRPQRQLMPAQESRNRALPLPIRRSAIRKGAIVKTNAKGAFDVGPARDQIFEVVGALSLRRFQDFLAFLGGHAHRLPIVAASDGRRWILTRVFLEPLAEVTTPEATGLDGQFGGKLFPRFGGEV